MKRTMILSLVGALALMAPAALARPGSHSSDKLSGLDKQYLKTSIQGDLFEIRGGKLALSKSHNDAVIRLARRLITDHTKSYEDAARLARSVGIKVPGSPMPTQQWELKAVARLRGRQFNRWYSSLEVYDHVQDIQEAKDEVEDGNNSKVRDDARTELPTLHEHLKLAREAFKASR